MKRYSDREIRSILHSAIRLHEEENTPPLSNGLSLEELEAAAKEAGISPEAVRRAAEDFETRKVNRVPEAFFGEPLTLVRAAPLAQSVSPEQLERLRRTGEGLDVDVLRSDQEMSIRVEDRLFAPAGGVFGGLLGGLGLGAGLGVGLGVGIGVLGSPLFAVLVPFAFLASSYALARAIYRRVVRNRRRRMAAFIDRIRALLML